jgi:hypothetical protein
LESESTAYVWFSVANAMYLSHCSEGENWFLSIDIYW